MHSAIYHGWLRHRRFAPREHAFRYRLFMVYLDLAELDRVFAGRWLWSTRRPAPAWFRRADHFGDASLPLDQCIRDLVERESGARPSGAIRLLTHLRYFGYCFNPASFYYCFDPGGEHIEAIVAEVTNTPWGERHCYVLRDPVEASGRYLKFASGKKLHVSPFMPMEVDYRWGFSVPGPALSVHMALDRGRKIFDATLKLDQAPITCRALARALATYPLMTLKVFAAIHWQAFRLWAKGVPVHAHPAKQDGAAIAHANSPERTVTEANHA